ncbi:hypothetical protein CMI42_06135 [Candidatus Pacearchaeota archaeon]|nr:hypothetical protein [Candidatus Pacearchaeota archaeon]|tara:strand:- start:616 stop:969 length:354 start_codon:yes stop_codon:yes gene_type:complete
MPKTSKQKLEKPTWLKYSEKEVKDIVAKLANEELTAEKIGLILRDQYGIPKISIYGMSMKEAMAEKFEEPTTKNLDEKLKKIIEHYKKNKQDKRAERSLIITKAKFKKRSDYQEMKK